MGQVQRRSLTAEFTDLERYSRAMRDGAAENMQLGAGPLRLSLALADFGPLRLHCNAVDNAYLARAQSFPDRWAVFFDLGAVPGATRINGFTMGRSGAVIFAPGAELHALAAKGQEWAMLIVASETMATMLPGLAVPREAQAGFVPDLLDRSPALATMARELGALIRTDPDRLEGQPVADAIVDAMVDALGAGLPGITAVGRAGRADRRRLRLVGAAVDYLESKLGRPVYTQAVSEALQAEPRAINAAFRSVYGVTLQHYLLTRRLNLARWALRDPDGPALVKQVALNAGFWHLGRFSLAYRRMFGEAPSETLARRAACSSFVPGVCAPPYSAHIKQTR